MFFIKNSTNRKSFFETLMEELKPIVLKNGEKQFQFLASLAYIEISVALAKIKELQIEDVCKSRTL